MRAKGREWGRVVESGHTSTNLQREQHKAALGDDLRIGQCAC